MPTPEREKARQRGGVAGQFLGVLPGAGAGGEAAPWAFRSILPPADGKGGFGANGRNIGSVPQTVNQLEVAFYA